LAFYDVELVYDVLRADDVVFSVEALNAYIAANIHTAEEVSA